MTKRRSNLTLKIKSSSSSYNHSPSSGNTPSTATPKNEATSASSGTPNITFKHSQLDGGQRHSPTPTSATPSSNKIRISTRGHPSSSSSASGALYCHNCKITLTNKLHIICDETACKQQFPPVTVCPDCFYSGAQFGSHANSHPYVVKDESSQPLYTKRWSHHEELSLIYAIKRYGLGNWQDVAEHVKTKNRYECEFHYWIYYVDHVSLKENLERIRAEKERQQQGASPTAVQTPNTASADATGTATTTTTTTTATTEHHLPQDENNATPQTTTTTTSAQEETNQNHDTTAETPTTDSSTSQQQSSTSTQDATTPTTLPIFNTTSSDEQLMNILQPELPTFPQKDQIPTRAANKNDVNKDDRGLLLHVLKKLRMPPKLYRQDNMPIPQKKPQERQTKDNDAIVGDELEYIPFRNDFSNDWSNDFEEYIAQMNIKEDEPEDIKKLKIQLLQVYDHILQERDTRKDFIFERDLLDWERIQQERKKKTYQLLNKPHLPFARFLSDGTFSAFMESLHKQHQLRRQISRLKHYRENGIVTLQGAEHYESELKRKEEMKKRKRNEDLGGGRKDSRSRKRRRKNDAKSATAKDPQLDASYPLLTEREQELCVELSLAPTQYIIMKDTMLREGTRLGYLSEKTARILFPNEDEHILQECLSFLGEAFSL